MKKGERSFVILPPSEAYGLEGRPEMGIPTAASVVYDIELFEFEVSGFC